VYIARSPEQTIAIRKAVADELAESEGKRRRDALLTPNKADELTRKLGVLLNIGTSVPGKDPFIPGIAGTN
jgi:hypothetical protein